MLTYWLLVRPSAVRRGSALRNSMANRPMPYRMRYIPEMDGGWKKDFLSVPGPSPFLTFK